MFGQVCRFDLTRIKAALSVSYFSARLALVDPRRIPGYASGPIRPSSLSRGPTIAIQFRPLHLRGNKRLARNCDRDEVQQARHFPRIEADRGCEIPRGLRNRVELEGTQFQRGWQSVRSHCSWTKEKGEHTIPSTFPAAAVQSMAGAPPNPGLARVELPKA